MNRDERQKEFIELWKEYEGGTLEACTGFGKTYTAVQLIKEYNNKFGNKFSTIVIVPTNYLKNQWEERVPDNVDVYTVHHVTVQDNNYSCNLLILDEIHRFTSDIFGQVYEKIKYQGVLGLTATIPEDSEKKKIINTFCPVIETIELKEAVDNGWVSDFIVYQFGVHLNSQEKKEYRKINKKFHKNFAHFGHDWNTVKRVLNEDGYSTKWANKMGEYGQGGRYKGHASRVMKYIRDRKSLLYLSTTKLNTCIDIVQSFEDKKIICFSQRTDFADMLADNLNDCMAYHSNVKGKEIDGEYYGVDRYKEYIMEQFKDSNIRVLSTSKALDEGADLPDIDMAIISSGTSSTRQTVQRIGRTLRGNGMSIIVDVYALNTQDEYWLEKRYDKVSNASIHKIRDINQISI